MSKSNMKHLETIKDSISNSQILSEEEKSASFKKIEEWIADDRAMDTWAKDLELISEKIKPILAELGLMQKEYVMDIIEKELDSRKSEIKKQVELLFRANMTITDWDVAEADDNKAAKILISIIKEAVADIEKDIQAGKYDY